VDFKSEEKFWTCIQPGREFLQQTYTGYLWRIEVGETVHEFVADDRVLSGSMLVVHGTGFNILSPYEAEKARIRAIFDANTTKKSGTIDFDEMKRLAPILGYDLPEAELRHMFDRGQNTSSSSGLTFDDFYQLLSGPPPSSLPSQSPDSKPTDSKPTTELMMNPPPPPSQEKEEEELPKSSVKMEDHESSHDPLLNDRSELEKFLNSKRFPGPILLLLVRGTHEIKRGDNTETVVDFRYIVPLVRFISGNGKWGPEFKQNCDAYHQSTNTLKRLTTKKKIEWHGLDEFRERVTQHIRRQEYKGDIEVACKIGNDKIQINTNDSCGVCLRHGCTDLFCCITCLCLVWLPIKYCWQSTWKVHCTYNFNSKLAESWAMDYLRTCEFGPAHKRDKYIVLKL